MTPTGTATSAARPMSTRVPRMAFAMPPPGSPTGFGIWVKKSRFTAVSPCRATKNSRKPSGARASPTDSTQKATTSRETRRRLHCAPGIRPSPVLMASGRPRQGGAAPRGAALGGRAPDEKPRQHVDRDGHDEEHQADLDQGVQVEVVRRLGELVG